MESGHRDFIGKSVPNSSAPSFFGLLAGHALLLLVAGHFQLMRNLCFATAMSKRDEVKGYGFVVYVAASPSAQKVRSELQEFQGLLLPGIRERVGIVSYEQVIEILTDSGHNDLATFLRERIRAGLLA